MFPPHYIKNATTGELKGWGVELAHALAARIGVESRPVEYPGPDKLLEGLNADACDAAFLVNSPAWVNLVDFSEPFLQQDFTFLLPSGSSIRSIADVDRPEVRIAVVRHHASTLELARILTQAKMVNADTLQGAFELLRNGQTDAFASTRPQLLEDSPTLPGSAVLEDRYGVVFSVMGVAKGRSARLAYINEFLRDAKTSGLVQRAFDRAGWRGVRVVFP
jgi:polar amino acid transport system substrate-binding protein